MSGRLCTLIVVVILGILSILAVLMVQEHAAHTEACREAGNSVTSDTKYFVGTGISPQGQPVTTQGSSTTYYCRTPDGRTVDTW